MATPTMSSSVIIIEAVMKFIPDEAIHPGEILEHEFMADFDLTPDLVAAALGVSSSALQPVLSGAAPLTAELSRRLARYFGNTPEFWLNLQRTFDLAVATRTVRALDSIRPVSAA